MQLHYFDFVPPPRWNGFRVARQVRLCPPETRPEAAVNVIVVSPLVPRSPTLPSAVELHEQKLAYETGLTGAKILSKNGPVPTKSDYGLAGMYFEETLDIPVQSARRVSVLLVDEICLYNLSYGASIEAFDKHIEDFWTSVRTIKPFSGRVITPTGKPFDHFGE